MSKRELKTYLSQLTKEQLEEQITDLYSRFKEVKEFYNFAFNPKEDRLMEESKFKIAKEYFPVNGRKAKTRRSVAQKIIRHFKQLGVDAPLIADIMLYNIEMAQTYSGERIIKQQSFYSSILRSFDEAVSFTYQHGLYKEMTPRIHHIAEEAWNQDWINKVAFQRIVDNIV